jgi:hypothetical protein
MSGETKEKKGSWDHLEWKGWTKVGQSDNGKILPLWEDFHVFPLPAKLKEPTVSRNQEKAVQSFKLNQLRNVE